jgi:hypothetical protein
VDQSPPSGEDIAGWYWVQPSGPWSGRPVTAVSFVAERRDPAVVHFTVRDLACRPVRAYYTARIFMRHFELTGRVSPRVWQFEMMPNRRDGLRSITIGEDVFTLTRAQEGTCPPLGDAGPRPDDAGPRPGGAG